jgi:hypothetical protein
MVEQNMEQPKSFIQIIFSDVGSTLFEAQMNGVTPLQILALAEYLHFIGESGLSKQQVEQEQRKARGKIVVPGSDLSNLDLG